jgi:hypothetical protein
LPGEPVAFLLANLGVMETRGARREPAIRSFQQHA